MTKNKRKVDPIKHCLGCGAQLIRLQFASKEEAHSAFLRRNYCGLECRSRSRRVENPIHPYPLVKLDSGEWEYAHIAIAQKAIGRPLPEGAEVHHFDENPTNNDPSNLVICQDRAYHKLLHKRQRIVAAGGDPNRERICCRCQLPKPIEVFRKATRSQDGLGGDCRDCANERNRREAVAGQCLKCGGPCGRRYRACQACNRTAFLQRRNTTRVTA